MADEFRTCREVLGWSREEAARRLGYASATSIRKIEGGTQQPPAGALEWLRSASAYLREHPTPPSSSARD